MTLQGKRYPRDETGARPDFRVVHSVARMLPDLPYAKSLVVSYKQPWLVAGGANRGARPNEFFLKMTAVEERSNWNRRLLSF
jgi:hypothetical protein